MAGCDVVDIYTLRQGDWKLIERAGAPEFVSNRNPRKAAKAAQGKKGAPATDQLFNLRSDTAEERDVSGENTGRVEAMKKFLASARDRGFTRPGSKQ